MTRLGSLLQVHPTSVTSAVDRLERQGFVARERSAEDRRVVLASLTDAGREVCERATAGLNEQIFATDLLDGPTSPSSPGCSARPGSGRGPVEWAAESRTVIRALRPEPRSECAIHGTIRHGGSRGARLLGHPTICEDASVSDLHKPQHHVRLVTASSLFDGHDASINIMRRIFQSQGCEVVHLGHNRSVQEVVDAALEEDAHGVAVSSYQGGHVEYFEYLVELLAQAGAATCGSSVAAAASSSTTRSNGCGAPASRSSPPRTASGSAWPAW